MSVPKRIINFLEKNKIKYELINHRTVYTAFDKAQTLKVPEKTVAKTLLLKADKKLVFVIIPAHKNLDEKKLKKVAKAKKISFLSENSIKKKIKGVKLGVIPPFGNLWKAMTLVDRSLMKEKKIILNSGDYNWSIKISPKVFKKLVPDLVLGSFSKPKKKSKNTKKTKRNKMGV